MKRILKFLELLMLPVCYIVLCYSFLGFSIVNNSENKLPVEKIDSISYYLKKSRDNSISLPAKIDYLRKASIFSLRIHNNDSLTVVRLMKIALQAYRLNDSTLFNNVNLRANEISQRNGNILGLAKSHYYFGLFNLKQESLGSSFHHFNLAEKNYTKIGDSYHVAIMLYNMATIQKDVKDFTGSEISVFKALNRFKELDKPLKLYHCYNLLGVIYNGLQEYNKSIIYHSKAISIAENIINDESILELSTNNLGVTYQDMGNYKKAVENFNVRLINFKKKNRNTKTYARILDNLYYSKLLDGDTLNVFENLFRAHDLRDSLNYISGLVVSKKHIADFFKIKKDTFRAIEFALESGNLAKSINNNRDYLVSLKLLSKLDHSNSGKYLNEYIKLNDSLQKEERKLRNKFTRIRFETDEHIQDKEKLSQQIIVIVIVSLVSILILALLYIIKINRSKRVKLILLEEQQKANEEIYNLISKQQSLIDKGRAEESKRISEELHDGIIGRIFGVRLTFGFLNFEGNDEEKKQFKSLIKDLQEVERDVRNISHQLSDHLFTSKQNFETLLTDLLKDNSEISAYKYNLNLNNSINWLEIEGIIKIHIFRIIQESLQNCHKHADASLVEVILNKEKDSLILTIKDNGLGFDTSKFKTGIGLKNIKSRVSKINGRFNIKSEIGNGTTITIIIPNVINEF